jgi:hypothetical protein
MAFMIKDSLDLSYDTVFSNYWILVVALEILEDETFDVEISSFVD